MTIEACAYYETTPEDASADAQAYGLDEERWLALPDEARVAFGIAWLEANEMDFDNAKGLTDELIAVTGLERDEVRAANGALLREDYLDRSGFQTGGALKLSLSEKGYQFLEEEVRKLSD